MVNICTHNLSSLGSRSRDRGSGVDGLRNVVHVGEFDARENETRKKSVSEQKKSTYQVVTQTL